MIVLEIESNTQCSQCEWYDYLYNNLSNIIEHDPDQPLLIRRYDIIIKTLKSSI